VKLNKVGIALTAIYSIAGLCILVFQLHNVWGNLEASFLWAIPTFAASHFFLNKKITTTAHHHCDETCTYNKEHNDN
jgi:hypothetical protein